MFIDRDRLYVCSLSPEKITKEIENVDGYFLDGEKLIYEDTGGDLYYYNIRTEEKQKIIGEWEDYRDISIDNIRWTDKDSFYILDDNRKQLYCYSIKDNRGVRIAESEKNILGVIPKGEDVLLYLSSGEIAEYSMVDQKVAVLISGIDASIYMEDGAWRQKMSDNVIGCPFTIGGDGRLYYDNNLKLYAYDFQEKVSEEIIDFSNMEKFRTEEELEDDPFYYSYNYIIGKDSVILIQSETGKGEYVGFYDFNGELKKKELVKFSKWNTNKFARNFGY